MWPTASIERAARWLAPLPRHVRAMGYASELAALGRRSRRCASAWRTHLDNSREVMLEAAGRCPAGGKALIVGSGLLLDIPLAELAGRFREVVLADIAHVRRVRRAAGRFANVRLRRVDVTGVVSEVYRRGRARRGGALPQHRPDAFLDEGFDLTVSANVLSQLPVIPNGYAARRIRDLPGAAIEAFSRALVLNHLTWLARFEGVVCLITDLERWYCHGSRVVEREPSLWGIELPPGAREWVWDIAPRPDMDSRFDIRHRVAGYAGFPKQAWLDAGPPG